MNRQKMLLMALLGVLLLSLLYSYWASPRQERVATPPSRKAPTKGVAAPTASSPQTMPQRLRVDLLDRKPQPFEGVKRDIFYSLEKPPQPRIKTAPPVVAKIEPVPVEPAVAVAVAPLVTEELRQELARFTFLGFLEKDGVKTIFLSSADEIFVVKKGDRFGQKKDFLVTDLTAERLLIRQGEDDRDITVPLREQATLNASELRPRTSGSGPSPLPPAILPPAHPSRFPSPWPGRSPQVREEAAPQSATEDEELPPLDQPPVPGEEILKTEGAPNGFEK